MKEITEASASVGLLLATALIVIQINLVQFLNSPLSTHPHVGAEKESSGTGLRLTAMMVELNFPLLNNNNTFMEHGSMQTN